MTYFSLTFLLVFVPAGLLLFYGAPARLKNAALLLLSLAFYALMDARHLPLLLASTMLDYLAAALLHRLGERRILRRLLTGACVVKTVALIFTCLLMVRLGRWAMPAGLLVYALSAVGYVVDLYRGDVPFERNIVRFFLYCCFFGRILAGPYVRYSVIRPQLRSHRSLSLASVSTGLTLLLRGVAKKVVLADNLLATFRRINDIPTRDMTSVSSWLLLLFFALGIYYELGAYCDVARGLGQLFSFKLPRNISYPLHVRSTREFLLRFNTTFGEFLRRYVYRSLGGAQFGFLSDACNTVLYLMLFGAWFSLTPNCVLWGMVLAALVLGEKYLYGKLLHRLPVVFGRLYATLAIFLSFGLLSQNSLPAARILFQTLFSFDSALLVNDQIIYILSQSYWALLLGGLLSFPVLPRISNFCKLHAPALTNLMMIFVNIATLVVCLMCIIR